MSIMSFDRHMLLEYLYVDWLTIRLLMSDTISLCLGFLFLGIWHASDPAAAYS
jgi:hypothetical protein